MVFVDVVFDVFESFVSSDFGDGVLNVCKVLCEWILILFKEVLSILWLNVVGVFFVYVFLES